MGIGQRSSHKEASQRVAATRVLAVACAPASLAEAVQGLFDTWNSASDAEFEASLLTKNRLMRWASKDESPTKRHYLMLRQSNHLAVTFGMTPKFAIERGLNNKFIQGWLGRIAPAGSGNDGATHIGVSLLKWRLDDAGRIWNGGRYVQMLDGLVAGLNGRYISDPVNEEDCHFVSMA